MSYLTVADGTKIYYEDYGDGETILFSHGLNGSHLNFKRIINEFKMTIESSAMTRGAHGF